MRLARSATFLAVASAYTACAVMPARPDAEQRAAAFASWPTAADAPFDPVLVSDRCVILGREGAANLGEGAWRPTISEVLSVEADLPHTLATVPQGRDLAPTCLRDHRRQWSGAARAGRRVLIGAFAPTTRPLTESWSWWPESGPGAFRVEVDAVTHEVVCLVRSRIP